ncbi:unnamed protein product [Leuciscus chuanchicus]
MSKPFGRPARQSPMPPGGQVRAGEEEARGSQVVVEAARIRKKTARKPAIKWPQPVVKEPSAQGSSVPKPRVAVGSRPAQERGPRAVVEKPSTQATSISTPIMVVQSEPAQGAPVPEPEPVVGGQPVQGPPGSVPRGEVPAQESSDLGDSPRYRLEVEQEQVCLRVEPPRSTKAKKGLGPSSRSRAVGVLPMVPAVPVLPSLTPIQGQEEPMEVGDSLDSDVDWILEVSQTEVEVPRELRPVASEEATRKGPVVPEKETAVVVVGKAPGTGKQLPVDPVAKKAPVNTSWKSYHVRHEVVAGDKYKSWSLTPGREVLIVGDSNLSRIPEINHGAVEIHSYPGATLAQAFSLIKYKTPVADGVRHVVLSFGLNDRGQGNMQALRKCIERLKEAATATFPSAVLHIPLINYDPTLPEQQNPGGSVLYELQLSYGLFGKASEESITIIHPAGDESMHKFL